MVSAVGSCSTMVSIALEIAGELTSLYVKKQLDSDFSVLNGIKAKGSWHVSKILDYPVSDYLELLSSITFVI
jgi:hypothetical protein